MNAKTGLLNIRIPLTFKSLRKFIKQYFLVNHATKYHHYYFGLCVFAQFYQLIPFGRVYAHVCEL